MDKHPVDRVAQLLGPGGALSRAHPRYEARPAQLTLARRVWASLVEERVLVAEAGTGTGKTLAYLLPAALSELKVVISTGTKTLQEQIVRKDVPLARTLLGRELPAVVLKGVSNYLCSRRLAELKRAPQLVPDPALRAVEQWAATTDTGDRAELTALADGDPLWAEVSSTADSRLGPSCPFFDACFVTRARRAAAKAQVIVVNHHLLLADLALKRQAPSAGVIPPFEALVVDEAHGLEATATSFFGERVSLAVILVLGRDVRRAAALYDDQRAEALARHAEESAAELFYLLDHRVPALGESYPGGPSPGGQNARRLRLREAPWDGPLEQPYFSVDSALEALEAHLSLGAAGREDVASLAQRAATLRRVLGLFAGPPRRGHIFWAEQHKSALTLHASPVEVGPILQETLFAESLPVVLTSATLASAGGSAGPRSPLTFFRRRLGLHHRDDVEELVLPSPFCFERQALLYVPRDLPQPNAPEFIFRAAERMTQLIDITSGRALVLFTSYKNLRAARAVLTAQLDYPVLCQGDRPRSALLEAFRDEVESVLLATASFWEGVDVVGESLSLVIIDKLPFAVPTDPLTAARIDLLRERGDEPFSAYQLPLAALTLKQGFGRLIRHREDRGVVAVLDRRLAERPYGRTLLAALPPCPRTSDLLQVRSFCHRMLGASASTAPAT